MNATYQSEQAEQRDEHSALRLATPIKLSKEQLHTLSEVNPFISTCHILLEWTAIVLTAILCHHFWNPLFYLASVAFIGARQHALLILMHDGTHYRLFRNRSVNDWVTEVFLAWPHLATMRAYRDNHLAHHNYVNMEKDPDWLRKKDNVEWQFPQSAGKLAGILLRDLIGIGGINLIRLASSLSATARVPSKTFVRIRLGFYIIVLGGLIAAGCGEAVLMYWIVPYFTWLVFIMRIRSIAEHFAIEGEAGAYGRIRTTQAGLLARLFVAPKNVNYHIEHHFFPSVPFYRLPELHSLLMSNDEFVRSAHITQGYSKMLLECVRQADCNRFVKAGVRSRPASLALAER
jgi:fatty acid desaturase